MRRSEGKRLLARRLHMELQIFRYTTLNKSKREIYDSSYKIELLAMIYQILLEKIDAMEEEFVTFFLLQDRKILEFLYDGWLKKEDSSYDELTAHINEELEQILGKDRKEDGEEIHKAA